MTNFQMIESPNGFYRISVKALVLDQDKRFLLFLEENGLWELPGGGLDHGETVNSCLQRELMEEAGLSILSIASRPSYFITFKNLENQPKANIIYETILTDISFKKTEECIDARFFTVEEALKVKMYPSVSIMLQSFNPANHLPGKNYNIG